MLENDYAPSFQLGHPGGFELASLVAGLLPDSLDYVFFTNSGSEAVDTALKVALAWHHAHGRSGRTRFVARTGGYHGVNIGGLSLSGMMRNRQAFNASLPFVTHMRNTYVPECRFVRVPGEEGSERAEDLAHAVYNYGADSIAACIVEPVAGSSGVFPPPAGYLRRLREICDQHDIVLIFDEVICGFGRMGGTPFASQKYEVTPDIVTMAKALTNGSVPMGAVGVSETLYRDITESAPDGAVEFFHGYTYSAHPVACAAGLAAQNIYASEELFARAESLIPFFHDSIFSLRALNQVSDIRVAGLMAGVELHPGPIPGRRGADTQTLLFTKGLHVKFTADTAIVAPAFIASEEDIQQITEILRDGILAS